MTVACNDFRVPQLAPPRQRIAPYIAIAPTGHSRTIASHEYSVKLVSSDLRAAQLAILCRDVALYLPEVGTGCK